MMNKKIIALFAVALLMPFSVFCMAQNADDTDAATHTWNVEELDNYCTLAANAGDTVTFTLNPGAYFDSSDCTVPSWLTYDSTNEKFSGVAVAGNYNIKMHLLFPDISEEGDWYCTLNVASLQYTVSFNSQGGSAVAPISVNQGSAITLPSKT